MSIAEKYCFVHMYSDYSFNYYVVRSHSVRYVFRPARLGYSGSRDELASRIRQRANARMIPRYSLGAVITCKSPDDCYIS